MGLLIAGVALGIRMSGDVLVPAIVAAACGALLGWLGGPGVLRLPLMRRRGVNLRATRGTPTTWIVAHVDSKWQPVSMTLRVAGVIVSIAGLLALAGAVWLGWGSDWLVGITMLATLPLLLSVVGERSDGALDNASGVATALGAASLVTDPRVGVMITDAEELALAGARAWAREARPAIALNVDSVDDDGPLVAMYTGSAPRRLISRLEAAASARGEQLRVLRLVPGILTDSVALAAAGWETVTLSRGTLRTLARIHTSWDTLSAMDGRGIAGAARVLADVAHDLATEATGAPE
jgi:hypothetical protein